MKVEGDFKMELAQRQFEIEGNFVSALEMNIRDEG